MTTLQLLQTVRKMVNAEKCEPRVMPDEIQNREMLLQALVWEIHDILEAENINEN